MLPIDRPPIEDGWIEVAGHSIVGLGGGQPPADAHDLGHVAVMPGLVNAHTHLELSWMAGRVPPAASLTEWIRALMVIRRAGPSSAAAEREAVEGAIRAMTATGTVLVGDVSNSLADVGQLVDSALGGVVFHELLGFAIDHPEPVIREAHDRLTAALGARLRGRLVAHAPYSVSPALMTALARVPTSEPLSIHLGESSEEAEFLNAGTGAFRALLEDFGAWSPGWRPPGTDAVTYLARHGYLQPGLLAVHATHLGQRALERLAAAEATVVTCPRSNEWVGAGMPRVAGFYASGVRVAVGTDSLASVPTLNLFDELAELRRIAPDVAAASLLESATRVGADALGFGGTHGTLTPGKRAALVVVAVPDGVVDVEEYLVGGVDADAIRPLM